MSEEMIFNYPDEEIHMPGNQNFSNNTTMMKMSENEIEDQRNHSIFRGLIYFFFGRHIMH
jgi:hypothetical protein